MALNLEVSNRAPALPVELTNDLMDSFGIFCATYGGTPRGQQSQKALQCFPIAWACLAVKEAEKKSKEVRDRDVSRCYQEIALPGWIKLCHRAITESAESDNPLRFPAGLESKLYFPTLGVAIMGNRKKSRKKQEVHFQEEEGDQQQLVDFEPEGEDEDQHVLASPTGPSSPSPWSSSSSLSEDEGNPSHRSSDDDDGVDRLSSMQLLEATCKEEVKAYLRALRHRQTPPELSPATIAWQQRLLTESVPASSSVATASDTSSCRASSRGTSATAPTSADTVVPWSTIVRSVRAGNEWIISLAEFVAHCARKHVYLGVVLQSRMRNRPS
ncbi:unnamed protein product [Ectocarpus sp. CCAP 1310/34]|nr:unnamed protein product [Ectocarpus sp. CCAP 1310/34]